MFYHQTHANINTFIHISKPEQLHTQVQEQATIFWQHFGRYCNPKCSSRLLFWLHTVFHLSAINLSFAETWRWYDSVSVRQDIINLCCLSFISTTSWSRHSRTRTRRSWWLTSNKSWSCCWVCPCPTIHCCHHSCQMLLDFPSHRQQSGPQSHHNSLNIIVDAGGNVTVRLLLNFDNSSWSRFLNKIRFAAFF